MKNIHHFKNKKYVNDVFDNVYQNYDFMNDIMSFGTHRLWKQEFVNSIEIKPEHSIIDMSSGTGDISNLILKKNSLQKVLRIEPNYNMLNHKISKFNKFKEVRHVCGYAETIPLKNCSYDSYIISFGLRNVTKIDNVLNEAFRVLKKGGGFYCLEFYKVNKPIISEFYKFYSKTIPFFGKLFNKDSSPYEYLIKSIEDFHSQNEIKKKLIKSGFANVNIKNIFGGIASIHYAWKLND